MTSRFDGKVVLVTGAAGGIGAATVRALLAEGATAVASDLKPPAADLGIADARYIAADVSDRASVDRCHSAALARGGACEGPPGLRPHYHPNYYGAYFRDPDGNKLCVCCHEAE